MSTPTSEFLRSTIPDPPKTPTSIQKAFSGAKKIFSPSKHVVQSLVKKTDYAKVRGIRLVEARILALETVARQLVDASKKEGEKSIIDEGTTRELNLFVLAMKMLKDEREDTLDYLIEMHDHCAEKFDRSRLVRLVKNDATNIANSIQLKIHESLSGQAVRSTQALSLRVTASSIAFMEYLGGELLRQPPLKDGQIDCETMIDPMQEKQIRDILASILQAWTKHGNQPKIQTIIGEYDQYAKTENWHDMYDATHADHEKVKAIDMELVQQCRIWQFDKK